MVAILSGEDKLTTMAYDVWKDVVSNNVIC